MEVDVAGANLAKDEGALDTLKAEMEVDVAGVIDEARRSAEG